MSRHGGALRKKRRARLREKGMLRPIKKGGETPIQPWMAGQLLGQIRRHEGLPDRVEWSEEMIRNATVEKV